MAEMHLEVSVTDEFAGMRLDALITAHVQRLSSTQREDIFGADVVVSRSRVEKWIAGGRVAVDGEVVSRSGMKLKGGEVVSFDLPREQPDKLAADPTVNYAVVYDDSAIAVIDKPAGLVVHPGSGCYEKTLVHGLLARFGAGFSTVGHPLRPGIVHRLDKDTSGLMVVAKTEASYQHLIRQFTPPRTISRTYLALCRGAPQAGQTAGTIELPIGRSTANPTRMAVRTQGGKEALTRWKVREELRCGVLLELALETGRTHQIRVHLASSGAPILGDSTYGSGATSGFPPDLRKAVQKFGRQALHACRLALIHPQSGEQQEFTSSLPAEMEQLLSLFRAR